MRVIPVVIASLACGLVHSACLGSTKTCNGHVDAGAQSVIEEAVGAHNGRTTSYILRRLPLPNECVTVVENGLPLKQGADYQIEGHSLTLSADKAPRENDDLRIVFDAEPVAMTSAVPSRGLDDYSRSMLRQALIESAGQETISRQPGHQQAEEESPRYYERAGETASVGTPSQPLPSLAMLVRRMSTIKTSGSRKTKSKHGDSRGFEGMGDDAVASPYSYLFGLTSASGLQDRSVASRSQLLPSFTLLQRLLTTVDQDAPRNDR